MEALRWLLLLALRHHVLSYRRVLLLVGIVAVGSVRPCTRQRAREFQWDNCFLPSLHPDLSFHQASFVLSHDAATGYFTASTATASASLSTTAVARAYSQTQASGSTLYDQLEDGARALDIRPYLLTNGTVLMHHGPLRVPVTFGTALSHVVEWCGENTNELVLVLVSHIGYQSSNVMQFGGTDEEENEEIVEYDDDEDDGSSTAGGLAGAIAAMSNTMDAMGIPYYECSDVYDLTIQDVLDMTSINNNAGGHLLVLWNSYNGRSCAKENWVEDRLVTCYPRTGISCTHSRLPWRYLQDYMAGSALNDPTDQSNTLGPPSSRYYTPLNEIQALWQVNTRSVVTGVAHASSLLADNRQSRVNALVAEWLYDRTDIAGVLVAVDNVALHGNAILSVLRNHCSQVVGNDNDDDDSTPCGTNLPPPRLSYHQWWQRWTKSQWLMGMGSVVLGAIVSLRLYKSRRFWGTVLARGIEHLQRNAQDELATCYHRDWEGGRPTTSINATDVSDDVTLNDE